MDCPPHCPDRLLGHCSDHRAGEPWCPRLGHTHGLHTAECHDARGWLAKVRQGLSGGAVMDVPCPSCGHAPTLPPGYPGDMADCPKCGHDWNPGPAGVP